MTDPIRFVRELWTPTSMTLQPAVFAAQLRALYEGCRTSIPFGVLIGVFMVWSFWGYVATSVLLGWFVALTATTTVVSGCQYLYRGLVWLQSRAPTITPPGCAA